MAVGAMEGAPTVALGVLSAPRSESRRALARATWLRDASVLSGALAVRIASASCPSDAAVGLNRLPAALFSGSALDELATGLGGESGLLAPPPAVGFSATGASFGFAFSVPFAGDFFLPAR